MADNHDHDPNLDKIRDAIKDILSKYPDYSFLVTVIPNENSGLEDAIIFGNVCLRCTIDYLLSYCIHNRINHLDGHNVYDKVH